MSQLYVLARTVYEEGHPSHLKIMMKQAAPDSPASPVQQTLPTSTCAQLVPDGESWPTSQVLLESCSTPSLCALHTHIHTSKKTNSLSNSQGQSDRVRCTPVAWRDVLVRRHKRVGQPCHCWRGYAATHEQVDVPAISLKTCPVYACTTVAAKALHSNNCVMQSSCKKVGSYVYTGEISANALAAPCSPCKAVGTHELCTAALHNRHCTACTMCSAAHTCIPLQRASKQADQPQMLP